MKNIIQLTESELKNVIKGSIIHILNESYGGKVIRSPKLYKLLSQEGINDIILVKGDGYFYLNSYDDNVYYNIISNIENNYIPCFSFSQQSVEDWVDDIKKLLSDFLNENQKRDNYISLLREGKTPTNVKDLIFISYGTDKFDPRKTRHIKLRSVWSRIHNKPEGGVWASPVCSKFGWADFCNRDAFQLKTLNKHFLFKLNSDANIYIIDTIDDLKRCSYFDEEIGQYIIDVPKLVDLYDGIYLTYNGAVNLRHTPYNSRVSDLSSWDIESICIFNPYVIEPIEEDAFERASHHKYEKPLYEPDDEAYYWGFDDLEARKQLQIDADFERYSNRNLEDTSKLFKGEHPGIAAQKHGNNKSAKLARRFNGTIKSGM